jgi:hypothetical protein
MIHDTAVFLIIAYIFLIYLAYLVATVDVAVFTLPGLLFFRHNRPQSRDGDGDGSDSRCDAHAFLIF